MDLATLVAIHDKLEPVELRIDSDAVLRGVARHASDTGPLLVHFVGSGSSIASKADWKHQGVFGAISSRAHSECNSLAFDYRGVGASSGERDARKLSDDAWAVWEEALRRVDGDPRRIVLRGGSLGTLAVLSILERGATPRVAVLFAPVRPETMVHNWLAYSRGSLVANLLSPWFRKPMSLSVERALTVAKCPVVAIVGAEDTLLTSDEKRRLAPLVESTGGCWIETPYDHYQLMGQFAGAGDEETAVLDSLFPEHSFGMFGELRRAAAPFGRP